MKNNKVIIVLLVIVIILMMGIIGFGGYKYMQMDKDYNKLNNDYKEIKEKLDKQEQIKEETNTNNSDESYTNTYLDILGGKQKYINKDNNEVYIKKLKNETKDAAKTMEYSILDMDGDGSKELVARVYNDFDGFVLILHYEEGNFYGFEDVVRGFTSLKTNGYYVSSGGYNVHNVTQSTFNKNIRNEKTIATEDNNEYTINGKKVTQAEYTQFLNNLEDVNWIKY